MSLETALRHAIDLLLSPLEEPFQRYLDVCDDIHACDAAGNTLLHWAAALGNFSAAYSLLQRGLAVEERNAYGATPLHLAAALSPNAATMGFVLVSHGASLDAIVTADVSEGARHGQTSRNSVKSLFAARQLEQVWEWLWAFQHDLNLQEDRVDNDRRAQLGSFAGSRELPPMDSLATSVLCSAAELQQLRVRNTDTTRGVGSSEGPLSVPRPPPRRQPPQLTQPPTPPFRKATPLASNLVEQVVVVTPTIERHITTGDATASDVSDLLMRVELLNAQEAAERLQVEKSQLESFLDLYAAVSALAVSYYDEAEADANGSSEGSHSSEDHEDEIFEEDLEDDAGDVASMSAPIVNPVMVERSKNHSRSNVSAAPPGPVEAVLGERIDAEGQHHLLVRFYATQGTSRPTEAWYFAHSLLADPVVRAHLERTYSATTRSPDTSEMKTPSIMTLRNVGSPLDTWEREQLEAQLRLLPRRVLPSRGDGSPVHAQPLSTLLASPNRNLPSPHRSSTPLVTDFIWRDQFAQLQTSQQQLQQQQYSLRELQPQLLVSRSGSRSFDNNALMQNRSYGNSSSSGAAVGVYEQPTPSSSSLMPERAALDTEKESSSFRYAARNERLQDNMPTSVAANTNANTNTATARQLLLSDGRRGMRRSPDVLVEGSGEAGDERQLRQRSPPQPASVKSTLHLSDCSNDTLASVSPVLSTAPTKAPTTYNGSSLEPQPAAESHSHLTASQKADYNNYLYGAALRVLERQQQMQRRVQR